VARLVAEGARVVVADIDDGAARETADRFDGQALAVAFDAADVASIAQLIDSTMSHWGRLDILHNNAALTSAVSLSHDLDVVQVPFDLWDQTMQVNLRAYFAACKYAIPHMQAAGGGSIINTTSTAALTGDLSRSAYSASKAGVVALTRSIAVQYGRDNIRCNAIAPGLIVTENARGYPELIRMIQRHTLTPQLGAPSDIAAMVAFLASDDARFITAQTMVVDGGMLSHAPHTADMQ
jgi:NAD(P)-dependent dehydrogenase (short-subunit alcohol dehydrogenase family)